MAAPDQKQIKRAREETEKGLGRHDAALAAQGLLKLPEGERESLLPKVSELFHAAVLKDAKSGRWSQVSTWAAKADTEPRLLGEGERRHELTWRLLWGTARSKDWKRAQRLWSDLEPVISSKAPALAAALGRFVEQQGVVSVELAEKLPVLTPPDPRLGYDIVRTQAPVPAAPKTEPEARVAVLQLWVASPARIGDQVRKWSEQASPELRHALWTTAAQVALVEILRARTKHYTPAVAWATLIARAGEVVGPEAVRSEILTGFRTIASVVGSTLENRDEAASYGVLAAAAVTLPDLRAHVLGALSVLQVKGAALENFWRMLEKLLPPMTPTPVFWSKAVVIHRDARPDEMGNKIIDQATRAVLSQPDAFAAWLRETDLSERKGVLFAVETASHDVAEALINAVVAAGPRLRSEAARLAATYMESYAVEAGDFPPGMLEMARQMNVPLPPMFTEEDAETFRRVALPLLPESPDLLAIGLQIFEDNPRELRRLAEAYLHGRQAPRLWLLLIATLDEFGYRELVTEYENQLLKEHEDHLETLAEIFDFALKGGAPRSFLQKVARRLRKLEDELPAEISPPAKRALERASWMVSKPKAKATKAKPKSTKAKPKSTKAKPRSTKAKPKSTKTEPVPAPKSTSRRRGRPASPSDPETPHES